MTKHEAQVAHASSTLLMVAVKSNQYADRYPDKAAKAAESAEFYATWLNANGRKVEMEVQEVNGQRRIKTVTIDGETWVRNGFFVNNPGER